MSKICGFQIGKQICDSLGLDPSRVRSIELRVAANELVTARVEHFVDGENAEKLINVLSAYTLMNKEDVESAEIAPGDDVTAIGSEHDRMLRFFKESS